MSAQKRKATAVAPVKSKQVSVSSKKLKPNGAHTFKNKNEKVHKPDSSSRNLPTTSILVEEETTFPRGRSDGLNPLEKKQIQLKADRDVLFEESGQKPQLPGGTQDGFSDEDDFEAAAPTRKAQESLKDLRDKNLRKREHKLHGMVEVPAKNHVRVGQIFTGRISKIEELQLILDLPNHRKGVVPITAISSELNTRLEAQNERDDEEDDDPTDLQKHFRKGQRLGAMVTSVVEASYDTLGKPTKGRIELSVNPQDVNKGVSKDSLLDGTVTQASVVSIEDHGMVMNLGLKSNVDVRGFMASGEIPNSLKYTNMKPGMVLRCVVVGSGSDGRVVKLSANKPELDEQRNERQPNLGLKNVAFTNPVDEDLQSLDRLMPGFITKAQITSVKDTQINVMLADKVHGRIDVSEAFQTLEDVPDRKRPLKAFQPKTVLPVRVLGIHDSRNHRFLPISHRGGHVPVFELSARLGTDDSLLSLDQLKEGEGYMASVNNVSGSNLWVNLSPSIRGRVGHMDLPQDVSDISAQYPIGCLLRVWVKKIDLANSRLDVSTRSDMSTPSDFQIEDISQGMILPGRITKIMDSELFIQLSPSISGVVPLTEMADDFDDVQPHVTHEKNQMIRVYVVSFNQSKKKITLSSRQSKVLSSSLPVKDKAITSLDQLRKDDIVRGFIRKVGDIGLYVTLAPGVMAFVPIAELSDDYLKEWKMHYKVNTLVTGRIIELDSSANRIHLSLKRSAIDPNHKLPLQFKDMKRNQVVTGKVRKVEEFGAFIVVDNSYNVSGLCHRSNMADREVEDARELYSEGDKVTVMVVAVDTDKQRISFGLKASLFERKQVKIAMKRLQGEQRKTISATDDKENESEMDENVSIDDSDSEGGVDLSIDAGETIELPLPKMRADIDASDDDMDDEGLDAGGFDWNPTARNRSPPESSGSPAIPEAKKKRKKRAEVWEDHTADVADHGPQTSSDFERLLLADRDDPALWIKYMSYHVKNANIPAARKTAERATRSIGITRDQEKLEVWTAWLNLELLYGDADPTPTADVSEEALTSDPTGALSFLREVPLCASVKEVFAKACAVHDRTALTERLVKSLRNFGRPPPPEKPDTRKLEAASALYHRMSHEKLFTVDPTFWVKYATFLLRDAEPRQPQVARALATRATQVLPEREHARILMEFARLEFKLRPNSERGGTGDPERGRTLFTDLLSVHPKRFDFWDIWSSLEESLLQAISEKDNEARQEQESRIRDLFERQTGEGTAKMKKKRAQGVFGRWLRFEEECGKKQNEMQRAKRVDRVKAKERRYKEKLEKERDKADVPTVS